MGSVINIDQDMFQTCRFIRDSISLYRERNTDGRFNRAIDKDTALYKEYLAKVRK